MSEDHNMGFRAACGSLIVPLGGITLEWYVEGTESSCKEIIIIRRALAENLAQGSPRIFVTYFVIVDCDGFDILLGARDLSYHELVTFNRHLFVLESKPLTKEGELPEFPFRAAS